VWIPKYRKAVLTGEVAIRVRDLLRQIAAEHELEIMSGKVARDHVHVFVSYRPNQQVSQIVQWLKGISSRVLLQEFPHLRKTFWGRHSATTGLPLLPLEVPGSEFRLDLQSLAPVRAGLILLALFLQRVAQIQ
jgi:transposase IS200 family protein